MLRFADKFARIHVISQLELGPPAVISRTFDEVSNVTRSRFVQLLKALIKVNPIQTGLFLTFIPQPRGWRGPIQSSLLCNFKKIKAMMKLRGYIVLRVRK